LVQQKFIDTPTSFILIIIFFDEALKYGDGETFWGYVGTNAEPLCVNFCNFVQCNSFVDYLTYYYYAWYNSFLIGMTMV
jgi:hypothetical protein